jgi:hypothetical protein
MDGRRSIQSSRQESVWSGSRRKSVRGRGSPDIEVHNKWVLVINNRLKLDCDIADDQRFEKKVIPVKKVLHTWTGVLEGEYKLPTDWMGVAEVLVGIRLKREQEGGGKG